MVFRRLRQFLGRPEFAGVAFSESGAAVFSAGVTHSLDNDASDHAARLNGLVRQSKLAGVGCAVSLPLSQCKLNTVTLPRCGRKELRNIISQPLFWQEYLNADLSEHKVWWQRVRCAEADKTRVLAAAAPVQSVEYYQQSAEAAGFVACRVGIVALDFIAAVKHQHRPCCVVVMDATESFAVSIGDFGIRAGLIEHDAEPDHLSTEILRLLKSKNSKSIPTRVIIVTAGAGSHLTPAGMTRFLPDDFSLEVMPIQQFAQMPADTSSDLAYAALRCRYAGCYADFSADTAGDSQKLLSQKNLKPALIGAGLFVFGIQGYMDWNLGREYQRLFLELAAYSDGEQEYQQHRQDIVALRDEVSRQTAVLDDIAKLELSDSVSVRVLEMIEQAASYGIWLNRTEFSTPSLLRIEGKAIDNESVAHYSNTLRQYSAVAEVRISSLERQPDDELVTFALECSLNLPIHLTDA